MMKKNNYIDTKVLIQGGSSIGMSTAYAFATKTDIENVLVVEKNNYIGGGNSAPDRNSQSLHVGRMEQYDLEKAAIISSQAQKTIDLCIHHIPKSTGVRQFNDQNLLGIGEKANYVRNRYQEFKQLFPDMKLLERDELALYEPMIMKGRDIKQDIVAMHSKDMPSVNFGGMARCLKGIADETKKDVINVLYNTRVVSVDRDENNWYVTLEDGRIVRTKYYINTTSGNSIYDMLRYWAKHPTEKMLYGDDKNIINKGDIGYTGIGAYWVQIINMAFYNKFYQTQKPGFSMAAFHIDPKVGGGTTGGPTAFPTWRIEPDGDDARLKFWELTKNNLTLRGLGTLGHILTKNRCEYAIFMLRQMSFNLPYIGNRMLLEEVRKFLPSAHMDNLVFPKIPAGIRVQEHANKKIGKMERGPLFGSGIYHTEDMTGTFLNSPSPGASISIHLGEEIAKSICEIPEANIQWEPKKSIIMSA